MRSLERTLVINSEGFSLEASHSHSGLLSHSHLHSTPADHMYVHVYVHGAALPWDVGAWNGTHVVLL